MSSNPHHSSASNDHFTPTEIVEAGRIVMGGIDLDPASSEFANRIVKAGTIYTIDNPGHAVAWKGRAFVNPPGGVIDEDWRFIKKDCHKTGSCGLPIGHKHKGKTSSAKAWWFKLVKEWQEARVSEAIFIGFSMELLQSAQAKKPKGLMLPTRFPFCIPKNRLKFDKEVMPVAPDEDGAVSLARGDRDLRERRPGNQPTHGNAIMYLPRAGAGKRESILKFASAFASIGEVVVPASVLVE